MDSCPHPNSRRRPDQLARLRRRPARRSGSTIRFSKIRGAVLSIVTGTYRCPNLARCPNAPGDGRIQPWIPTICANLTAQQDSVREYSPGQEKQENPPAEVSVDPGLAVTASVVIMYLATPQAPLRSGCPRSRRRRPRSRLRPVAHARRGCIAGSACRSLGPGCGQAGRSRDGVCPS